MSETAQTGSTDDRRQCSQRGSNWIVAAMLDLAMAGAITPRAEDVAARAEAGPRDPLAENIERRLTAMNA